MTLTPEQVLVLTELKVEVGEVHDLLEQARHKMLKIEPKIHTGAWPRPYHLIGKIEDLQAALPEMLDHNELKMRDG